MDRCGALSQWLLSQWPGIIKPAVLCPLLATSDRLTQLCGGEEIISVQPHTDGHDRYDWPLALKQLQQFKAIMDLKKKNLKIHLDFFFFDESETGNPSLDYVQEATPREVGEPSGAEPKHTREKTISMESSFFCHLLSSPPLLSSSSYLPSLCPPLHLCSTLTISFHAVTPISHPTPH